MLLRHGVRVLCYHSISDLSGDPQMAKFGIPRSVFEKQMDDLLAAGYTFINGDSFIAFLRGKEKVPRKSILLTFDDGYSDFITEALPVLRERRIPAVVFIVSGFMGQSNAWDYNRGASRLPLLTYNEAINLADNGVEIGSHSRTHRKLDRLSREEVEKEICASFEDLMKAGFQQVRMFAYPGGHYNESSCEIAGKFADASFTIKPGVVHCCDDPTRLPRVLILRGRTGWRFRLDVYTARQRPKLWTQLRRLQAEIQSAFRKWLEGLIGQR